MTLKLSSYFVGEGEGWHMTGYMEGHLWWSGKVQFLDLSGGYKGVHLIIALQIIENNKDRNLKWKVKVLVAQSCPTLWESMDCSQPGFSVHGILQARILEWVVSSFSRGSSQPRDRTWVSCILDEYFTVWATVWCKGESENRIYANGCWKWHFLM